MTEGDDVLCSIVHILSNVWYVCMNCKELNGGKVKEVI